MRSRTKCLVVHSSKIQWFKGLLSSASIVHSTTLTTPTMEDLLIVGVGHRQVLDSLGSAPSWPRNLLHKKARCGGAHVSVGGRYSYLPRFTVAAATETCCVAICHNKPLAACHGCSRGTTTATIHLRHRRRRRHYAATAAAA